MGLLNMGDNPVINFSYKYNNTGIAFVGLYVYRVK